MLWVLIRIASMLVLHKNICCGYSLESLGEAILMSSHNICFYGEINKIIPKLSSNTLLICSIEWWRHKTVMRRTVKPKNSDVRKICCNYSKFGPVSFEPRHEKTWFCHMWTTSSPKGNNRSPESNVPRSNLMETRGPKSNSSELLCLSWLPATLMMIW